ncbi:MAG: YbbR-like domain-containing protein [Salinibacter sp.]
MAADADSHIPIFLERIRGLFRSSEEDPRPEDSHNGMAITVCVMLSFVLWLSLSLQERRTVSLELPVEAPQLSEDQAFAELPPSTVTVRLQGRGMELLRLLFSPPTVEVEATGEAVDVEEALQLSQESDTRVESVTPRTITVATEPRVERRIPIQSRVTVRPADAYELIDEPTLRPDSVAVTGAKSVVDELEGWPTRTQNLTGVRDTVETTVSLADTLARLVTRAEEDVTLVARAGKFSEDSREVKVEVTGIPSSQELVALQPSTIRIRYRVLFDQLFQAQRASGFFATVSYSQIRSDTTGYVEPQIQVPSGLEIRDPEPVPSRLRYYTSLSGELGSEGEED